LLAKALASVMELVQETPLLSKDQIKIASRDNVCMNNALAGILGGPPSSVDEALQSYKKVIEAAREQMASVGGKGVQKPREGLCNRGKRILRFSPDAKLA